MEKTDIVQFVDVQCEFRHFNNNRLWNIWSYKINPYLVRYTEYKDIRLLIESNQQKEYPIEDTLLHFEKIGFFENKIFRTKDGGYLWDYVRSKNAQSYLKYYVSHELDRIVLLKSEKDETGCIAFEYLGQIVPFLLLKQDVFSFHGVLMEYNGSGVIISAASGTGKTTHARLWRDYKNALIINGDRAVCKHTDKGWIGYGTPWSGTSGEQINRSVPLKALVVLERSEENSAEVIYGMEAFGAVFPHILYPSWDKELTEKAMDLLEDFMNHMPIIRLKCRPDVESVDVLNQVLEEL